MITNLSERQKAMRERVSLSRSKTKAVLKHVASATREADRGRELRDAFRATLDELRQTRRQAYKNLEHLRLSKQRALARAARYSQECDRELEKIDLARQIGASL